MRPPPIIALVGPTGAGKTELAIAIAQRLGAEIVGADSRQVYRRLDIGSAKPTGEQQAAVRHHLIDVVDPSERFDCARFRTLALAAIADIRRRGRGVLVVGGTGLYVRVLRGGLFSGPGRDAGLRARLRREEESQPGVLHHRLRAVDPTAAARLHPRDRVRVIRALEVYELTGSPISSGQAQHGFGDRQIDMQLIGLSLPRPELYARIDARCAAMIDSGLIDEVRGLLASGLAPDLPALRSPGYLEIGEFVRGLRDLDAARARMAQATRRLAKRQLTWFRAEPGIVWCRPEVDAIERQMAALSAG